MYYLVNKIRSLNQEISFLFTLNRKYLRHKKEKKNISKTQVRNHS